MLKIDSTIIIIAQAIFLLVLSLLLATASQEAREWKRELVKCGCYHYAVDEDGNQKFVPLEKTND